MIGHARFFAGIFLVLFSTNQIAAQVSPVPEETLAQLQRFSEAFATVAATVRPGVVTIFSEKISRRYARTPYEDEIFRRFFGIPEEDRQGGIGSGVIVSEQGFLLTNNHVIEGADRLRVELSDGRSFRAQIVGSDPKSDLAVLKIEGENLPVVPFGDSDKLRVGEWVLAIGSPFGLQHTVTSGIVSAVGRGDLNLADYEDFIQTDAAINPGNSGGALVNLQGELIGINTAIVSRSGGYQGIGLAIPVKMARNIMKQLVESGEIHRGYLGVRPREITPELADALGIGASQGVLIEGVENASPAAAAGLKPGDVVLSVNRRPVRTTEDLRNRIAQVAPQEEVELKVVRNNQEWTAMVTLGALETAKAPAEELSKYETDLGMEVQELSPEFARKFGYEPGSGVLITRIWQQGVAYRARLRPGDLVVEINRKPVQSLKEYAGILRSMEVGEVILMLIRRDFYTSYVTLRLPG